MLLVFNLLIIGRRERKFILYKDKFVLLHFFMSWFTVHLKIGSEGRTKGGSFFFGLVFQQAE